MQLNPLKGEGIRKSFPMDEAGSKLLPMIPAAVFTGHPACLGGVDVGYRGVMPGSRGAVKGWAGVVFFLDSLDGHQSRGGTSKRLS